MIQDTKIAEHIIKFRQRFNNKQIKNFDNNFVQQFLLNDSIIVPTEALLIQTESLNKIVETIKSNKSFCFKTDPGEFGWCATCKVYLPKSATPMPSWAELVLSLTNPPLLPYLPSTNNSNDNKS